MITTQKAISKLIRGLDSPHKDCYVCLAITTDETPFMFPKNLFLRHLRDKNSQLTEVLVRHQYSAAIIPSGLPKPVYWDDNNYPFRANFHFSLFVPAGPVPHSYLIIRPEQKPLLIYFQPLDYWHVVPDAPSSDWADGFDIIITTKTADWLNHIPQQRLRESIWLGEPEPAALETLAKENINPRHIVDELHYYRAIKTDYEIDRLAQANLRAATGHMAAKQAFLEGACELDIHLQYLKASHQTETELPYGNIIALGPHCAVLHYTELKKTVPDKKFRQTFLIDAGAKANHYCADITRTWSKDDQFIEMVSDFDLLQQEIVAQVKPGVSFVDLHLHTHQKLAEFMVRHELLLCSAEQAVSEGITTAFLPHGLGHLLGLQVHDIGGHQHSIDGTTQKPPAQHPYLRLTRTLEPGYCVTIEPGIYFIEMLLNPLRSSPAGQKVNWPLIEALQHFGGIRIEDDVVVTEFGYQNLSRQAFQQIT